MNRRLSLHCIKQFVSEYNHLSTMPAEVFVSSATSKTETTWEETSYGLTNSISLKSGEFLLSDESNGHFETSELSHSHKCSKCLCAIAECMCVIESHQMGPAYCPNPNDCDLPREYETHVQIFMRVPEMVPVEKTFYQKQLTYEKRKVLTPRSRIVEDEIELIELVPTVKMVPQTRTEIVYKVVEEEIEVTEIVLVAEFEDVCRLVKQPRVVTEDCEETIMVPVVKEVPVTRVVEEWTGRYCESEVEKFCSPGDFNLICEDSCHHKGPGHNHSHIKKSRSSASSLSGDSPKSHHKKRNSKDFSVGDHLRNSKDFSVGDHLRNSKDFSVGDHLRNSKDFSVGDHLRNSKNFSVGEHLIHAASDVVQKIAHAASDVVHRNLSNNNSDKAGLLHHNNSDLHKGLHHNKFM